MRFDGVVAVITGSGGGVGRAMVPTFAKRGTRIVGGVPDVALITMSEVVAHAERVARSVEKSAYCDMDMDMDMDMDTASAAGCSAPHRAAVHPFQVAGIHLEIQAIRRKAAATPAIGRLRNDRHPRRAGPQLRHRSSDGLAGGQGRRTAARL